MKRLILILATIFSLGLMSGVGAEDTGPPPYSETFSPYENRLQWGWKILKFEEQQDRINAERRAQTEAKATEQEQQARIRKLERQTGRKVKSWQLLNR